MVIKDIIKATKLALNNMNKDYCKLSLLDYDKLDVSHSFFKALLEDKFLERPIAYEFYHQFRKLMEEGIVNFGEPIIQAEVFKKYQHCFEIGKMPDFIIHLPNSKTNLAVIEFKLASRNIKDIKIDFDKIVEFKRNFHLQYQHGIEVILGSKSTLDKCNKIINEWNSHEGEDIIIILFDMDFWKASHSAIKYNSNM